MVENNKKSFRICEAIDCYQSATESIVIYVGKFGAINLNLCHRCAVIKFQTTGKAVPQQHTDNIVPRTI